MVLAARQPAGAKVMMRPEVHSPTSMVVDVAYPSRGWLVKKHYHVSIREDRVAIELSNFHLEKLG